MPTFFFAGGTNSESPAGRVVGLADEHSKGTMSLVSTEPTLEWTSQKSIITRITVSQQGNFQFLHTIGNDVYIYVFGDRIGQITLSGLSFSRAWGNGCNELLSKRKHGFEYIMEWYQKNRVAERPTPITVTVGENTKFKGFVVGVTGDAVEPSAMLVQYGIQIATIPEKR